MSSKKNKLKKKIKNSTLKINSVKGGAIPSMAYSKEKFQSLYGRHFGPDCNNHYDAYSHMMSLGMGHDLAFNHVNNLCKRGALNNYTNYMANITDRNGFNDYMGTNLSHMGMQVGASEFMEPGIGHIMPQSTQEIQQLIGVLTRVSIAIEQRLKMGGMDMNMFGMTHMPGYGSGYGSGYGYGTPSLVSPVAGSSFAS